jgi:AraC-like DNA-binding protein
MKEIHYAFVELESDESFLLLGSTLGGMLSHKTLHFDNDLAKGELVKVAPEEGLWIRKWKFSVNEKIILHRLAAPHGSERKFSLIYFLNPSLFDLRSYSKKVSINSRHNIMFLSNEVAMDFSVLPHQPFYVLDITFTSCWLLKQFDDAAPCFKMLLDLNLNQNAQNILTEPCCRDEYPPLRDLDIAMMKKSHDLLLIRSRIYQLICSFFIKAFDKNRATQTKGVIHYDQLIRAEAMIMDNLKKPPKIAAIARKVNMSVSSLLRQFKSIYGKGIYEYYTEKRLELAQMMLLEKRMNVKELAQLLGYRNSSPFIEMFTKKYGISPGTLKQQHPYPKA